MKRVLLGALLLVHALVGACAPADEVATTTPSATSAAINGGLPPGMPSFLSLVPEAHMNTPLMGIRRAEFHWQTETGEQTLIQLERVAADGRGRFLVDPLSVQEPALTTEQADLHALLQKNREGFLYRWRDFRIRNLGLFVQNWQLAVVGEQQVAGRTGVVVEVRRQGVAPLLRYRAVIDPPTGLVLRHDEYDADGKRITSVSFEELAVNPVLPELAWHAARFEGDELQAGAAGAAQLGVQPSAPQVVPEGYQLDTSEVFEAGGMRWLRRVYGDGIDVLFFLQAVRPPAEREQLSVHGAPAHRALMYRAGPGVACDFGRQHDKVMVIGRLDDAGLLHLLRSIR